MHHSEIVGGKKTQTHLVFFYFSSMQKVIIVSKTVKRVQEELSDTIKTVCILRCNDWKIYNKYNKALYRSLSEN